ncbi:GerMN domain-containing protein [Candidatus Obscuribacterales bacterium]|nr:GerMN domain-containing protein [Candidatus Obscuribacterales bacterium]MBX3154222.1 GerMN domain-containing protein [Candidatus Obscuribacterales bacterium]
MNKSRSGLKVAQSKLSKGIASCLTLAIAASMLSSCGFFPMGNGGGPRAMKSVTAEPYVPRGKDLKVFFVREANNQLDIVPISRPKYSSDALTGAIEELLQGPDNTEVSKGVGTEIPRGTILLGIKRSGDNVELNLSKRFAASAGPTSMETRLEQLSRTVKAVEGDVDVYVNIEGERLTATSADGLEIAQPINQQPEFN